MQLPNPQEHPNGIDLLFFSLLLLILILLLLLRLSQTMSFVRAQFHASCAAPLWESNGKPARRIDLLFDAFRLAT